MIRLMVMRVRDVALEFVSCIVIGIIVGCIIGVQTDNMIYVVVGLLIGILVGISRFIKFVRNYK
jgi:F0F1-type ATP synthase assembly protein I